MIVVPQPSRYADDGDFDEANAQLLRKIPSEQMRSVLSQDMCDIDPSFLGFVNVYSHLSKLIPLHFTVVDLGCAYAPQAFFFDRHREYVGVDASDIARFSATNSRHFTMPIRQFLDQHGGEFEKATTFAICSYVPPWGGDNRRMVREFFENVFTYYHAS